MYVCVYASYVWMCLYFVIYFVWRGQCRIISTSNPITFWWINTFKPRGACAHIVIFNYVQEHSSITRGPYWMSVDKRKHFSESEWTGSCKFIIMMSYSLLWWKSNKPKVLSWKNHISLILKSHNIVYWWQVSVNKISNQMILCNVYVIF